jgi:transcriptional regulator with XRE-family HTH domain
MRDWLITIRKKQGLTQEEVANRSFIHRGFYSQIENGYRNPSVEVATSIAHTLNFHASKFFTERISDPFSTILGNSPITLALFDLDLKYTWLFNLPEQALNMDEVIGKTDCQFTSDPGMLMLKELKAKVITTKKSVSARIEVFLPFCEHLRTYDIFCNPIFDDDGEIIGGSGVAIEVKAP